jgi:hypothetical protein
MALPAIPTDKQRTARVLTTEPERISWNEFRDWFLQSYRQDEHVSLLGPNGVGKTTLASEILEARECVLVIATKPEDPIITRFERRGYRVQETLDIPTVETQDGRRRPHPAYRRIVLWPRTEVNPHTGQWRSTEAMVEYQKAHIVRALEYARRSRRWTVFTDDVMYLVEDLQLGNKLKWFWRQGRSAGLSLVVAAQRPAWVPRDAYSAPQHLFLWQTNDRNDLERLADIGGGLDRKALERIISQLRWQEFLYIRPRMHPVILLRSKVKIRRGNV